MLFLIISYVIDDKCLNDTCKYGSFVYRTTNWEVGSLRVELHFSSFPLPGKTFLGGKQDIIMQDLQGINQHWNPCSSQYLHKTVPVIFKRAAYHSVF